MTLSLLTLRVLWIISLLGYVLLLARLVYTDLHRTHRAFAIYLFVQIAQSVILLPIPPRSNGYFWAYWVTQAAVSALYVLVVVELYSMVFEAYPGIARCGRYAIHGALLVALVISFLLSYPSFTNPAEKFPILLLCINAERLIVFALLLFIVILNALLVYFPVPLTRNTVLYTYGFSAYLLTKVVAQVAREVSGHETARLLGAAMLIASSVCTLFWAIFVRPAGETRPTIVSHGWRSDDRRRLIGQLTGLSAVLDKSARSKMGPQAI